MKNKILHIFLANFMTICITCCSAEHHRYQFPNTHYDLCFLKKKNIRFCLSEFGTCDYIDCLEINNDSLNTPHWEGEYYIDDSVLPITPKTTIGRPCYALVNKPNNKDKYSEFDNFYSDNFNSDLYETLYYFAIRIRDYTVLPKTLRIIIRLNTPIEEKSLFISLSVLLNQYYPFYFWQINYSKDISYFVFDSVTFDVYLWDKYVPHVAKTDECSFVWDNNHYHIQFNHVRKLLFYGDSFEKEYKNQ